MTAGEVEEGLLRLGIVGGATLAYGPHQNGKIESFRGTVESRLMAMLEGVDALNLKLLNDATVARVEQEYHRREHRELGMTPHERLTESVDGRSGERLCTLYSSTSAAMPMACGSVASGRAAPNEPGGHGDDGEGGEEEAGSQELAPHMRGPWMTVCPPRSVLGPRSSSRAPRTARQRQSVDARHRLLLPAGRVMAPAPMGPGGGSGPGAARRRSGAGAGAKKPAPEREDVPRSRPRPRPAKEISAMARTTERPSRGSGPHGPPRRPTWRERVFVLGGIALAAPATAVSLVLGADGEAVGFVWLIAVAWTAAASLACALRRGIAHGDWSTFRGYELPDSRGERFDWETRTGEWAWMRLRDDRERLLRDDSRRNHDRGI